MPPKASADPRAVLLHGEESFLVDEEVLNVLGGWKETLVSEFGFQPLDPSGLTATKLRDAILQAPFLDPHRIVVVRGIQGRRAESLASALKEVPETTRLLLAVNGRLGAGNALLKAFNATPDSLVREFPRLKARAIADWTGQRARDHGLGGQVVAAVIRSAPADLGVIDSELRKLAAYRDAGNPLDLQALSALLVGGREEDVFRLTDHLLPRPDAEAWRITRALTDSGQSPTALAYRLARHLALVLSLKARRDRGDSLAEAQSALSEHPFVVQKAYETAAAVDSNRLEAGLKALLDYEWEVKSGQVDAELGLEGVLARL